MDNLFFMIFLGGGTALGMMLLSFFPKKKERAEVGQSPTFLAPSYRYWGLEHPPGVLWSH